GLAPDGSYPFDLQEMLEGDQALPMWSIDTRPLIRAVAEDVGRGTDTALIARRFHSTMVELIALVCARIRAARGLTEVVMSGGVLLNALLTCEVTTRLEREGFRAYRHRLVPPNDGGLSLGQLAIAACAVAPLAA